MHLIYCNNALRLTSYEKLKKNKSQKRVITSTSISSEANQKVKNKESANIYLYIKRQGKNDIKRN